MANFTANQAEACMITRCESFKTDDVHQYWVLSVTDENGCIYEWKEETLPGSANLASIRASVKPYLMGIEMKTPAPVKTTEQLDEAVGQYVGDGSPF